MKESKYPFYEIHITKIDLNGTYYTTEKGSSAMTSRISGGALSYPYVTESQYKKIVKILEVRR